MVRSSRFKKSLVKRKSKLRTLVSILSTTLTLVIKICSRNTEPILSKVPLTKCITKWVVITEYPETELKLLRLSNYPRINSESRNQDVSNIKILKTQPSLFGERLLDLLYLNTEPPLSNKDLLLLRAEPLLKFEIK